jgi:ankyrin repeat protein
MTVAMFDVISGGGSSTELRSMLVGGCDWDGRVRACDDFVSIEAPRKPFELFISENKTTLVDDDRATPTSSVFGGNAVHLAAACGRDDLLDCLLDWAPSGVESKDKRSRETPLHFAARFGHLNCVKILFERGSSTGAQLL